MALRRRRVRDTGRQHLSAGSISPPPRPSFTAMVAIKAHGLFWSMPRRQRDRGARPPWLGKVAQLGLAGAACAGVISGCSGIYTASPPEEPPVYCTVFNYMVKSGGTNVKDQLFTSSRIERQLKPGVCASNGRTVEVDCVNALYNSAVILGYGEMLRMPLKRIGRKCRFFTVMRHPVDRLVSAFFHCPEIRDAQQRRPAKWCGATEMDEPATSRLLDFATTRWKNRAFHQMTYAFVCPIWVHHLCGDDPGIQPVPPADLTTQGGRDAMTKVQRILSKYAAVGIAEKWELSMALFDAKVRSPVRHWDPTLAFKGGSTSALHQEVLEWASLSPEIHRALSADMLLYDLSLSLFKNQTHAVLGTVWD